MPNQSLPSLIFTKLQRPRVGSRLIARPRLSQQLNATPGLTIVETGTCVHFDSADAAMLFEGMVSGSAVCAQEFNAQKAKILGL